MEALTALIACQNLCAATLLLPHCGASTPAQTAQKCMERLVTAIYLPDKLLHPWDPGLQCRYLHDVFCMDSMHEQGVLLQCFVVSTLVSMTPANAFIFRNYELSPGSAERARQVRQSLTLCSLAHQRIDGYRMLHSTSIRPIVRFMLWVASLKVLVPCGDMNACTVQVYLYLACQSSRSPLEGGDIFESRCA